MLISGALALDLTRTVHQPQVSPSWGTYTDPQWHTLQQRYGALTMATSMPPLSIVAAKGCLVVLRGMTHVSTVCNPTEPMQLFLWRSGGMTNVVGITSPAVSSVVTRGGGSVEGAPLLQAPHARVFGIGFRALTTLTAYDTHGHVLERLQVHCASALRGACGISEQRRS